MPQKLLKAKKQKLSPKKEKAAEALSVVLVATYKAKQLDWMTKEGVYNYPVKPGDTFDPAAFSKIKELWLYADVKGTRHAFTAEFVGKMSSVDFLKAHPTYAKLGKPKNAEYYVFKTTPLEYGPRLENPVVIARAIDFGGRSAKVKKAVEQYKADGEFAPLTDYLPADLAQVPRSQLRVCDSGVWMSTWTPVVGMTLQQEKLASIVMSIANFGKAHSMSVSAAYDYLNKYSGVAFLDEYYSTSQCYTEQMMDESLVKVCRNHGGKRK